ncbi:electron transfer flavoprotein subunit alpha [Halogeometricum borinquense DSM 11551]|uniref:Electron transfer flavoprotein subunit alpha n=1 Tax=Halogeometricum borinquense (strain ATCC 700274 / DSM 11551 / JCM 10706 / KCTC 4070 / PR3) TaxID=469382 RepID=E4NLV9_HALBP|nr:electron transfer flavoprotein subunit alpha/FixB family protein [Halogeometricum borinquense]ADQ68409.1 electron transfer flavoprotein, alpha subunit [Halogeometricum borinquense DSM 11551]ELY31371.1 electron transfer flavoprotein subunit alpha [Halogeometricum borinquense DSM 11551]
MSDILAVAEHRRGDLRDVSYELVTAGRELAEATGGDLHLAIISGDVDTFASHLNLDGVDTIHTVEYGEEFNHDVYTQAACALTEELDPQYVLTPNSVNGLDYAPAVANRLGLPVVSDAIGMAFDGGLTVTREMYGSKVETTIEVDSERAVVTIRGGEWEPTEADGDADVAVFDFTPDESEIGSRVTGFEEVGGGDVDITEADVLVSVGRGIEEEENIELVERLADALGATLSSSRPIVDNGWLPKNRQVGQSGKVVTPDVYIAVGISGAVQHVAGMKGSETIVAINTDPNAPIFDIADYGVVGDLFDVVPELIDEFQ